jgi:elongation factor G
MSESNSQDRAVLSVAVRPTNTQDRARFGQALRDLVVRDPTVIVAMEGIDGWTVISGRDELHIESICTRIAQEYAVPLEVGEPQILYLETVRRCAEGEGRYIRQAGSSGNYGHVRIRLEPNEEGASFEFIDEVKDGVVPRRYIEAAEQGIRDALQGGAIEGYEVVDVRATLFDGSYDAVESNEMAFRIAGAMAFKEAARKAAPVLLEPVMALEVVIPEEYLGMVIGDLHARRGRIQGTEQRSGLQVIKAQVPLSEMLGYETNMRLRTAGRLEYSMHLHRYEEAPRPGGGRGEEGAGVTANKPRLPRTGSGSAAARLDTDAD